MAFSAADLRLDPEREVGRIVAGLRRIVTRTLHRQGLVLGVSGGVDSALCLLLAVRALGPERVFALLMPERESSPALQTVARRLVEQQGVPHALEDLTPALTALGCYQRRDAAIRSLFPDYTPAYRQKLLLSPAISAGQALHHFHLVVESPAGVQQQVRLPLVPYLEIVAATSMKQRTRKNIEYYHADRLNYAVLGTANRLELDQGFFVKNGDGAADVKPIAHLYKTQVYQLAAHLGLPDEVLLAPPSSDTYTLPQSQEEFFFGLPPAQLDLLLYALERGISEAEVAAATGLSREQVTQALGGLRAKRRTTRPLRLSPLTLDEVLDG